MSNSGNGQPPTVASLVKRVAQDTMGMIRTGGNGQTKAPNGETPQQPAGRAVAVTQGGTTAAEAAGDALRALTPQRTLSMLGAGTGSAGTGKAAGNSGAATAPKGGPLPPGNSHAPFAHLGTGSADLLLEAARSAHTRSAPSASGQASAPNATQAATTGAQAGFMADSLAAVIVPAAAMGPNGRMRDAWRQMREHRRRRGLDGGPKGRLK